MTFRTYICICLLCIIHLSCNQKQSVNTILLNESDAIDSINLKDLSDTRELHNLLSKDSNTLISYSYMSSYLCQYTREHNTYTQKYKQSIKNAFHYNVFFLNELGEQGNFIDRDNIWYTLDTNGELIKYDSIKLDLKYLKEDYQLVNSHERPIIFTDTNLIALFAEKDPSNYLACLSEKSLVNIHHNNSKVTQIEYLFEKPQELKDNFEVYPMYCKNKENIYLIYPCIDTIYTYNLRTKTYESRAIQNPNYSSSERYDYTRWNEADYRTKLRLNNFSYTGIFFNQHTNHLVIYYTKPVDKNIEIPTFKDKKYYAFILNADFTPIKTVEFANTFRSPASFLPTKQGIYMPIYLKNQKDEETVRYYLFNL